MPIRAISKTSRRVFTHAGLAAAGLGILPTQSTRGDERGRSAIDAHAHVWTPATDQYALAKDYTKRDMRPTSFTPEQLMQHARPAGVERVVLIQMSFYGDDNSYMLDAMRAHPGVFSGVAVVNEDTQPIRRMKQLAAEGVRGFRIRPGSRRPGGWLTGDGMRSMWKCGADEGLSMCHLIDPEFLPSVNQMCQRFPKTPVVIDHFARIGIDGVVHDRDLDNLCRLADHEQVTVKVSAFYALGKKRPPYRDLEPMILRLLAVFGAQRLMWASDCPYQVQGVHSYSDSIDLIRSGLDDLSASDRDWILRKTAERVFFG